jgi:translation initiation factor 1A
MDGKKRMATIRGAMKNRVWINSGDIVLLGLRDFGDDAKCDIILKYFDEEAKELQELGEIPEHIKIAEGGIGMDEENGAFYGPENDEDEEGDEGNEEEKKEIDIDAI